MASSGESGAADRPLSRETIYLVGRLSGVTRRRLELLLARRGGKLVGKPGARVTMIAVGHSATANVLPDGRLRLPGGLPKSASMLSERGLRRFVGLLPPPDNVERGLSSGDLERLAGLTPTIVSCLALFDVLEPVGERYSYRDLVAAREAGRLLARGIELRRVLEASAALQRRDHDLSDTRLTEGPSGALVRELAGQIAELNGQLTIGLSQDSRSVDDLIASAEEAEADGDLAAAENLYTTALRADSGDPVIPFNLGNIFDAQERPAEAKIAWQIAVARDPAFAEAWYNLAMSAEDGDHIELAIAQYRRAVQARPDYADAQFNLALLLTRLDRPVEALALWDRFLELDPKSRQATIAKRAAALCRMQIQQGQAKAG